MSFQLIFRDISFIGFGTFQNNLINLKLLDTVFSSFNTYKRKKLINDLSKAETSRLLYSENTGKANILLLRKITIEMKWKI